MGSFASCGTVGLLVAYVDIVFGENISDLDCVGSIQVAELGERLDVGDKVHGLLRWLADIV